MIGKIGEKGLHKVSIWVNFRILRQAVELNKDYL